jgi:hypothetical protein
MILFHFAPILLSTSTSFLLFSIERQNEFWRLLKKIMVKTNGKAVSKQKQNVNWKMT